MPLAEVNLREYAERIRTSFGIHEEEEIDYDQIAAIPTEIERRRELFKYFIPDVYSTKKGQESSKTLGKVTKRVYDRRMDVIDGCIYYLERISDRGEHGTVINEWRKRARLNRDKAYDPDDVEEDVYGYVFYHPLFHVLGSIDRPELVLPELVKHLQFFKGKKRKLDLNDHALLFLRIFNSRPAEALKPVMREFLSWLYEKVQKRPLVDSRLKDYMKEFGISNVRTFHAQFKRLEARIYPLWEKAALGLDTFVFSCPYPHHVRATLSAGTQGVIFHDFFFGGMVTNQIIRVLIPQGMNWKALYRKFPPQTRCYRSIKLYLSGPFLINFDCSSQDWIDVPWDTIRDEWQLYRDHHDYPETPVQPVHKPFNPTRKHLEVCNYLERSAIESNRIIHRVTKIPINQLEQIRADLDEHALIARNLMFLTRDLYSNLINLTVPGKELWKYQLLVKVGEQFPGCQITLLEDTLTSEPFLQGTYMHTSQNNQAFVELFTKTFHQHLDFKIYKSSLLLKPVQPWYSALYDPEIDEWVWDPDDYIITPVSFKE